VKAVSGLKGESRQVNAGEILTNRAGNFREFRYCAIKVAEKQIIGWTEYIDFPEWGIFDIKAKIDTGARSSALHVENLIVLADGRVRFDVVYGSRRQHKFKTLEATPTKWARVRSSTGVYRKRCFITLTYHLGKVQKPIEVSLVSRKGMLFRLLLGRNAIAGDFIVDVEQRQVLGKRKKKIHVI